MADWAAAFASASAQCTHCPECTQSFPVPFKGEASCPYCDTVLDADELLILREYEYTPEKSLRQGLPKELASSIYPKLVEAQIWYRTGHHQVLTKQVPIELKPHPPSSTMYDSSDTYCTLTLTPQGLDIRPTSRKTTIRLQHQGSGESTRISAAYRIDANQKNNIAFFLHLGEHDKPHYVWQFRW